MCKDQKDQSVQFTTVLKKYPSFRDDKINGCWKWLQGRRADDNAEGLWRVHDKLYNLGSFIDKHPGGREWLELTEGTDVTEAFENYHITPKASLVLQKYYVRDALEPRNYRFTYENDGFYRTLKRRVVKKLETVNKDEVWKSKLWLDLVVSSLFLSSIIAMKMDSYLARGLLTLFAGQCMAWINTLAHNFIHQRNNFRMYAANLVIVGWRDWRVFHGMSHHMYPNTYTDLEVTSYEPHMKWIPIQKRTKLDIWFSYLAIPFAYGVLFHNALNLRMSGFLFSEQKFHWDELMYLLVPLSMFLFGNSSFQLRNLTTIFVLWSCMLIVGSFLYSLMALSAGHHNPTNVHEGDEFKSLDYGLYQLRCTVDRIEAKANLFMTLTHFGDHMLHHLFPSLDHSLLPQLRDTLLETCKDFEEELKECSMLDGLIGQLQQLGRTEPIRLNQENNNK